MLLSGEKGFYSNSTAFAILGLTLHLLCIKDEIEAALDDANVYKFAYLKNTRLTLNLLLLLIEGYNGNSRHFGVTMEERGVSKLFLLKWEKL